MIFAFKLEKLSDLDWSTLRMDHKARDSERYLIAKDALLSRYNSQRLGKKILKDLMNTEHLPLALRHGDGRAHVIERFRGHLEELKNKKILDRDFGSVEQIVLPLVNYGRIITFDSVQTYWQRITDTERQHVFDNYDWLSGHLPSVDEWTLREICFRSDLLGGRSDDFFAPEEICSASELCDRVLLNYKQIKENILNEDFEEARKKHGERQKRFAPKSGEGRLYKEVKVRLHPDLIDTLKDTVGGGNRTAWIEEAIIQRLEREGVDFELPEQPPLPNR